MPKIYFDERVAVSYDATSADMYEPTVLDPTVSFLADLAGGGAALELAIGTGRVALPLSARGVPVSGIELSPAMVEQFLAKPGSADIDVTIGDMTTTRAAGTYGLVYLVYNTIMNLTSQAQQVDCFCNAARHLEPGGRFVIEVVVPALQRLPPGETVRAFAVTQTHLAFEEFDVATQIAYSHHYRIRGDRVELFSAPYRYVWPAELDLMARIAGMTLAERWAGWTREPFTKDSTSHVSVWQMPE